jgi:hypothetical protein
LLTDCLLVLLAVVLVVLLTWDKFWALVPATVDFLAWNDFCCCFCFLQVD